MKSLQHLKLLWRLLGDIPITDDDEIDEPFLHFPKGTDKIEVWHWFEEQNKNFIVGEMTK
ncbi:MAG: hypothetical protein WC332_00395 [Clostridia bacterium]|jgi:hypothetical protein